MYYGGGGGCLGRRGGRAGGFNPFHFSEASRVKP